MSPPTNIGTIFPRLATTPTATPQSFTQKLIELDVQLAPAPITNQPMFFDSALTGGASNSNTVTISGSRISARVQHVGTPKGSTAEVSVYGLTPSLMNQLSTLGLAFALVPRNTLTIRAGDAVSGLSTIFIGTILSAAADFNQAPDVAFNFTCQAGQADAVIPQAVSSYPNATDVGTIMKTIALENGWGFQNNGVNVTLPPTYLPGTGVDQYKKLALDADIQAWLGPGSNIGAGGVGSLVLYIWNKGGSRGGTDAIPLISPSTGLIGYPSYTNYGLLIKTIFNPQIAFGGQINVQSSLPRATGAWVVLRLDHNLASLLPGGPWESTISAFNPKYPTPVLRIGANS